VALFAREQKLRRCRVSFNKWCEVRGYPLFPLRTSEFIDYLRPIVLLALNTGLRRGELFNLKWQDADSDATWLTIQGETAKSGQTRRIPLNVEALAVLSGWQAHCGKVRAEDRIFPGAGGAKLTRIDTAWSKLVKRANLEDFRFHDLRHHFASRLVQSGIDLNTVRDLLGHADLEMVLRYAHLSPDRLTMAVEKVAR
jgi:integrase